MFPWWRRPRIYDGPPDPVVLAVAERLPRGSEVLDVGTGRGRNAWALAGLGHRVTAIDVDRRALAVARARAAGPRPELRRMDARALARLGRARFALALDVLGPASELGPEARGDLALAVAEVLAPGGAWLLFTYEADAVLRAAGPRFLWGELPPGAHAGPESAAGRWLWLERR